MKVYQIISENNEIDEAPVGMFRRAGQSIMRYLGSKHAAGAEEVSDEANNLKKELSVWMGRSNIKKGQLTLDDLEKFLNMKGYSGIAGSELEKMRQDQAKRSADRQEKFRRAGQTVGALGQAARAGFKAAGDTYAQKRPQPRATESIFEQEAIPLTNQEVDKLLLTVVQKAARDSSFNIQKGKFAGSGSTPAAGRTASQPSSTSGTAGTTSQPAGGSTGAKTKPKLSANVMKALSGLTQDERNQLIAALTGQTAKPSTASSSAQSSAGATAPPAGGASGTPSAPSAPAARAKGDTAIGPSGDEYVWQGALWRNKRTGRMSKNLK
jgi:hypothetical protein